MFSVGLKATHKLNSDSKTAAAEEAAKAFRFRPVNSVPQAAVASRPRASPLSVGGNFTKTDSQVSQLNAELRNLKSVVSNERRLSHTTIEDLRARLEVANASYQEAVRDLASSRHERSHLVSRDKFDQALAAVMKADAILVEKDAQLAAFSKKANEKSATSDDLQNKMQEIKDLRVLLTETETKHDLALTREKDLQTQLENANASAKALEGDLKSLRAAAEAVREAPTTAAQQPVGSAADPSVCSSAEADCLALEAAQKELHLATEAHTAAIGEAHAASQAAKEEAASLARLLDTERDCVASLREALLRESEKAIQAVAAAEQFKALGDPLKIAEEHADLRNRVLTLDASAVDGAALNAAQVAEREALVAQGDALMQRYNRFATLSEAAGAGTCVDVDSESFPSDATVPTVDSAGVHILSHATNRIDARLCSAEAVARVAYVTLPPAASPVGAANSTVSEVARQLKIGSASTATTNTDDKGQPSKILSIGDAILQDLSNLLKDTSSHYAPADAPKHSSEA